MQAIWGHCTTKPWLPSLAAEPMSLPASRVLTSSNDLSAGSYHLVTLGTDLGYHIAADTSLRFVARNDLSAAPLTSPYELFGVAPRGREAHQNLYASGTFETVTLAGWHNLLRYGLARRRAETFNYFTPATGLAITIKGANGYTASGTAAFLALPSREDAITTPR